MKGKESDAKDRKKKKKKIHQYKKKKRKEMKKRRIKRERLLMDVCRHLLSPRDQQEVASVSFVTPSKYLK